MKIKYKIHLMNWLCDCVMMAAAGSILFNDCLGISPELSENEFIDYTQPHNIVQWDFPF